MNVERAAISLCKSTHKRRQTNKVDDSNTLSPYSRGAKKQASTCSNRHPSLSQKRATLLPRVWKRMFPGGAPRFFGNKRNKKDERFDSPGRRILAVVLFPMLLNVNGVMIAIRNDLVHQSVDVYAKSTEPQFTSYFASK